MTSLEFYQIIAATFSGGLLFVVFLRSILTLHRLDKEGVHSNKWPLWAYAGVILAMLFCALMMGLTE
jgi:hypothetical protein